MGLVCHDRLEKRGENKRGLLCLSTQMCSHAVLRARQGEVRLIDNIDATLGILQVLKFSAVTRRYVDVHPLFEILDFISDHAAMPICSLIKGGLPV